MVALASCTLTLALPADVSLVSDAVKLVSDLVSPGPLGLVSIGLLTFWYFLSILLHTQKDALNKYLLNKCINYHFCLV